MRLRFLRPAIIGAISLLLLIMIALPAGAASRQRPAVSPRLLKALPHQTIKHINVSPAMINSSGSHFLYVEDGTCSDSIDVYKIGSTLTPVGNYPNDGCSTYAYYGTQRLSVTKANTTHGPCLVYGDQSGFVDSFPLNADGSLGAEVSHLTTATGAGPSDVHIAKAGNLAYVTNPGYDLESYRIGAGCALTFLSSAPTTQVYISFALIGSNLVAPDSNSGNIDTWTLSPTGGMKFKVSVMSQIASCPDSIAVQTAQTSSGVVTNVFTGQCAYGAPLAQGGQYTKKTGAISFLSGSPSSDPSGSNGAASTFDNKDSLLIQGEQYTSALGVYSISAGTPGVPGGMAFLEETPLAVGGESPTAFAQLGTTLFVDPVYNGDVEACHLSASGVYGCATIAVLTNAGGLSAAIAIL